MTFRVAIAAAVLTAVALPHLLRHRDAVRRSAPTTVVYGVAAVAGAQLCYFNAVEHLSVAVALLLEYSGTLLVVLWLWLRHASRPNLLTVVGAAVATAGLALVLDVFGDVEVALAGVAWGLGAAIGLAVFYVVSAQAGTDVPPLVTAWGGLVVGAAVLGLAAAAGVLPFRTTSADVTLLDRQVPWWVPLGGLALVAAALAYVAGVAGARRLGAKLASFVGLTEVLFAVVFAWVLVGESMAGVQLAGGTAVVAGIVLVKLGDGDGDAEVAGSPAATVVTNP